MWLQVEAYWCFAQYLETIQADFMATGMVENLSAFSLAKAHTHAPSLSTLTHTCARTHTHIQTHILLPSPPHPCRNA